MTKATVMTDGAMQRSTRVTLEAIADAEGAADYRAKQNGIVVEFAQEADAVSFRDAVLACASLRRKLANLSIYEA